MHQRIARTVLAVDLDRAVDALEPCHVPDTHRGAAGRDQRQVAEPGRIVAQLLITTDQQRYAARAFDLAAHHLPLDLGAQLVLQARHIEAEPPGREPVDIDLQVLHPFVGETIHILGTRDTGNHLFDLCRELLEHLEIRPEHLDRDIAACAGQHFRDAHLDRLGERMGRARKILQHGAQLGGEPLLVGLAPLGFRCQH